MAYRFFCRRQGPGGDYCVTVRAGKLCLALPNNSDAYQLWYKEYCVYGFMLVNKATNKATRHCGVDDQLQLANRPNTPDNSFLWTESEIDGYGFRFLVTASNNGLAMDARSGDSKGAHDDKYLSFSKNLKGDNQKWIFIL